MKRTIIFCLISLLVGGAVGYFVRHKRTVPPQIEVVRTVDTLLVEVEKPVICPKIVEIKVVDTIHVTDTVIVEKEQKHYRDTNYDIWVSGYRPNIDSMLIRTQVTTIIRTVVKERKWDASLGVGMDMQFSSTVSPVPYIEGCMSYSFRRWEFEARMGADVNCGIIPYAGGGIKYRLFK